MPLPALVPGDVVIDTEGLAKRYGQTDALVDLTMRVEPGEVFGFLGPNGAGKTTAVKLLLGLARPTGGGGDRARRAARRPQGAAADRLSAGAVPLPALAARPGGARAPRAALRAAAIDGRAPPAVDAMRSTTSAWPTGPNDRVGGVLEGDAAAARARRRAARRRRQLVVLDEPTSALDPVGRADVRSIIRRARDAGSTVFLNRHLLTEVERVCDRVAIVDHGRVARERRDRRPARRVRGPRSASPGCRRRRSAGLRAFGAVEAVDDGWLSIAGVDPDAVPDVVAAIVAAGGRVHAVEPGRATLEDARGAGHAAARRGRRRAARPREGHPHDRPADGRGGRSAPDPLGAARR